MKSFGHVVVIKSTFSELVNLGQYKITIHIHKICMPLSSYHWGYFLFEIQKLISLKKYDAEVNISPVYYYCSYTRNYSRNRFF